jgi:hypothetical protein
LGLKASTKNHGDTPSGQGVIGCNADAGIAFDYHPQRACATPLLFSRRVVG